MNIKSGDPENPFRSSPKKIPSTETIDPEILNFENFMAMKKGSNVRSLENIQSGENHPEKKSVVFDFDENKIIDAACGTSTKFGILLNLL